MSKLVGAKEYLRSAALERDRVPSFDEYPFSLPAVRDLKKLDFTRPVTFFVGENGSGKSTLLEAIAIAWGFNPEGGSKNFQFLTRPAHSSLHEYLRLSRGVRRPRDGYFLRAESFFNVASEIERLDEEPVGGAAITSAYGGVSLHAQSHGESFMALLVHRLRGKGLYLLDEPEAALSPTRQMAMLARMHELVRHESQFIIATHSPIILSYPDATILLLESGGVREVVYEQTEHFEVTRHFLNNHRAMLRKLLEDEEA